MPLFETIPINEEEVRNTVSEKWNLEIVQSLKASQNHTFVAKTKDSDEGRKYIVRVTPDEKGLRIPGFNVEIAFLEYLDQNGLSVCPAVAATTGEKLIFEKGLIYCVFQYAKGEPVNFLEWTWLSDRNHVAAVGRFIGRLHVLSQEFRKLHPELVSDVRPWTELHDGILKEAPISPLDEASKSDATAFGILHGDVNVSNYFWDPVSSTVCMFDWDQMQMGWFMYDLAQPIWGVSMMAGAGSPVDGSKVPLADVGKYTEWIVEAYESASGVKVDRDALGRMFGLRRELYGCFCRRALVELRPDELPHMRHFCQYVVNWLDREDMENGQKIERK